MFHTGGPINQDDEVEDEKEYHDSDLEGMEEHKSIILHLLSQLKLGMDLTKVRLNYKMEGYIAIFCHFLKLSLTSAFVTC